MGRRTALLCFILAPTVSGQRQLLWARIVIPRCSCGDVELPFRCRPTRCVLNVSVIFPWLLGSAKVRGVEWNLKSKQNLTTWLCKIRLSGYFSVQKSTWNAFHQSYRKWSGFNVKNFYIMIMKSIKCWKISNPPLIWKTNLECCKLFHIRFLGDLLNP